MIPPLFPDPKVTERIEKLAQRFGLKVIELKHIENNRLNGLVRDSGDAKWEWSLAKPHSSVTICIGVLFPSYIFNVGFTNSSQGSNNGHFFLNNYISDYLKDTGDSNQIQNVIKESSWQQNWGVELDILEKHLEKDLGKIITGEEWPDIPFNWQDYVEPAALDRIYQDQKNILDEEVPGNPRNAWIYFLDHFRKK